MSGRMTPILGLVSDPPLALPPLLLLPLLPQAVRLRESPRAPATSTAGIRFTQIASLVSGPSAASVPWQGL